MNRSQPVQGAGKSGKQGEIDEAVASGVWSPGGHGHELVLDPARDRNRRTRHRLDARRSWDPEQEPWCDDRRSRPPAVVMRPPPVYVVLAGLAFTLLLSGCGGASPEARARQTMTALEGTRTPTPLEEDRTAIARGTFTGIDRESRVILTAEASLRIRTPVPSPRIRTPVPRNVATHMAGNVTD